MNFKLLIAKGKNGDNYEDIDNDNDKDNDGDNNH